jgi:hypothetical protein
MTPRSASILVVAGVAIISFVPTKTSRSPPTYKPWTFAVIGDTQTRDKVMRWAMSGIKRHNITYGLHLGDMHWCGSMKYWRWKRRILVKSSARWLLAIGNHARVPCRGAKWKSWWTVRKLWTYFWHKNRGDTMRIHDVRGWRFIALDTASSIIPRGHVKRLQLALQTATGPVVLTMHKPLPIPYRMWRSTKVRYGQQWTRYSRMDPLYYGHHRRNRALWKTVLKYKNKIAALFNGHFHAYAEYKLVGIPGYVSGGGGGSLQRKSFYHWLAVTVTGPKKTDYTIKIIRRRNP